MKIIDTHCDALYKMQQAKRSNTFLDFKKEKTLDTNLERLKEGELLLQCFAIFISPEVPTDKLWEYALEQAELFHTEIIEKNSEMKFIKRWDEIDSLKDREIGAILTLEGADAFGNDLNKLKELYDLGVMSVGLTWNHANLCADGVGEERGAGLTALGKEVVKLNNEHRVLTDVSHLSIKGFWDVMELANYPIASHSNARSVCDHPRNLNDEQIKCLFEKNGLIHVVFNPPFIKENANKVKISDLIKHIDHLCSLGGVNKIGFGSDFDGIDCYITSLENSAKYQNLINELLKYYSEDEVKGFAYQNFLKFRPVYES
ncbi:dipeptidase [Pseudogracilibacillus sp. SO30301A]|uniref:dipeptidase n=1 Tax=Pseudogracilibacillus sp. SO30301A TaxID=3098291 RepID=UPI00300E5D40